jgi:hypothetical protein
MKTLYVGDIHLKETLVLPLVKKQARAHKVQSIVFLGDYTDDKYCGPEESLYELEYLSKWKQEMEKEYELHFLIGNHDLFYLCNTCYNNKMMPVVKDTKKLLKSLSPEIIIEHDGWLVSHAGVTRSWASCYANGKHDIVKKVNKLFSKEKETLFLYSAGPARGSSGLPSPVWADKSELINDPLRGVNQIVGHSKVDTVSCWSRSDCKLLFCDTLHAGFTERECGDFSLLVTEGSDIKIIPGKAVVSTSPYEAYNDWDTYYPDMKLAVENGESVEKFNKRMFGR